MKAAWHFPTITQIGDFVSAVIKILPWNLRMMFQVFGIMICGCSEEP
jgi:hypothetical protein